VATYDVVYNYTVASDLVWSSRTKDCVVLLRQLLKLTAEDITCQCHHIPNFKMGYFAWVTHVVQIAIEACKE